jgi:uncharacterized membrane protein
VHIVNADTLVGDYLDRLRAAAAGLPPGRREELVAEVRDHIATALDPQGTEADVRNVLDRLGPPEEIVRAEVDELPGSPATARAEPSWGPLEVLALLFIAGGFLLPVVGTAIGVVLLWLSNRWTTRQKSIGTAIALIPLLAFGGLTLASSPT